MTSIFLSEAELCEYLRFFWACVTVLCLFWWLASSGPDPSLNEYYDRIPVRHGGGKDRTHMGKPLGSIRSSY